MAKQQANPPPWKDEYSDGCSGPTFDWLPFVGDMKIPCLKHDKAYYLGGTKEDKLKADQEMKTDIIALGGRLGWLCAWVRFTAVRKFGKSSWNWLGSQNG